MQIEGLDGMDNRILDVIMENARLSYSEIGTKVGLSRVAVKNRMDQMEKTGVIRGYKTVIEPRKVPEALQFILELESDPDTMDEVLDRLAKDALIRKLNIVSGSCRIHAEGLTPNRHMLDVYTRNLYHNQKGVRRMTYNLILSTLKDSDGGIEYERRNCSEEQ